MISSTARRRVRSLVATGCAAALAAGVAGAAPATAAPAAQAEGAGAGAWIVTLKDGESPDRVADDHRRNEGAQVAHLYRHALRGYAARMSDTAAARVARDSRVAAVVPDRAVSTTGPKGGGKPGGGGSTPAAEADPTGVLRVGALDAVGSAGVTVAIIDTGIDPTHPDLADSIDPSLSINCSTGASWSDGNGHGTHVAGTVGALRNGVGVVGVAPGVKLAAVRVLDNRGSGTWSSIICGLDFVTAHAEQIQVANMSLGGSGTVGHCGDGGLRAAVCRAVEAGVTVVAAAGNSSKDSSDFVPAAYPEVITVSALADSDGTFEPAATWSAGCRTDEEDTFANFSNHGAPVDLIAPGVCIHSTWKGGGYKTISGTSMAAPHVAGAAALHKATAPSASPAEVQAALQAAGTSDWVNTDDRDRTKEPALHVGSL